MAKKNTAEIEGVSTDAPENKTKKKNQKWYENPTMSVIIGIWNLLVIASITYSSAVIVLGTEGLVPIILITPMAVFALGKLVKQFIKK